MEFAKNSQTMKSVLLLVLFFTVNWGFAQKPPTTPSEPQDTTKQCETPVKITPQQMDIEPVKKEKTPKAEVIKKEIPSKGPKKEPLK